LPENAQRNGLYLGKLGKNNPACITGNKSLGDYTDIYRVRIIAVLVA